MFTHIQIMPILPVSFTFILIAFAAIANIDLQWRSVNASRLQVEVEVKGALKSSQLLHIVLDTRQDVDTLLANAQLLEDKIQVTISGAAMPSMELDLHSCQSVLAERALVKYSNTMSSQQQRPDEEDKELINGWCYFTGEVKDYPGSAVSLDLCKDGIHADIHVAREQITVASTVTGSKMEHFLEIETQDVAKMVRVNKLVCGTDTSFASQRPTHPNRAKRQFRPPAVSSPTTRYIELYIMVDNSMYHTFNNSVANSVRRIMDIVSHSNIFYRLVDIYLFVVGMEIWGTKNKISYPFIDANSTRINSTLLLANLGHYRIKNIHDLPPHDVAVLFTTKSFEGHTYGRASLNSMCIGEFSVLVMRDRPGNYILPATILAHEIGHLLGLKHSDENSSCNCNYEEEPHRKDCLMSSKLLDTPTNKKWSECSLATLSLYRNRYTLDNCLSNQPRRVQQSITNNIMTCGNLFVEQGEECDCGPASKCISKCCNPNTCRLLSNASCATGSCCDKDRCTLRPKYYVCRAEQDTQCDLPDVCSGSSEYCTEDMYKHDGTPCFNLDYTYCYKGACKSHSSQCRLVWGGNATNTRRSACYTQINRDRHTADGNCGYSIVRNESTPRVQHFNYHSCGLVFHNGFCGTLHCDGIAIGGKPILMNRSYKAGVRGRREYGSCHFVLFYTGSSRSDFGQVSNGAKCATKKVCVNNVCTATSLPERCSRCQGRFPVCNQKGVCQCNTTAHCSELIDAVSSPKTEGQSSITPRLSLITSEANTTSRDTLKLTDITPSIEESSPSTSSSTATVSTVSSAGYRTAYTQTRAANFYVTINTATSILATIFLNM